jgi:hypothetical protein
MDLEERRKIIIEYIRNNPSCNQEKIVKYMEGKISRQTVLNTLDDLESDDMVYWKTQRQNSRDHKFFVKEDNILVSVSKELEEFDKSFFSMLTKVKQKFDKLYLHTKAQRAKNQSRLSKFERLLNLLSQAVEIFYEIVDVYMLRCILKWPTIIKDQDTIKKLYSILFSKISDMQFRMSEILRSTRAGDFYPITQLTVFRKIYETENFLRHFDSFTRDGINEIESLLDSIWKIGRDFRPISFPEAGIYKWGFDYENESWKELLRLQREHPDHTYQKFVSKQLV